MYKEKTDRELIELLAIHKKLTFQSQLNLKAELNEQAKKLIETQEFDKAVPILKQASELGNAESQYNLKFKST